MTWHDIRGHRLWHGDCVDMLATMPADSVDAVVTDPPYGLGKPPDPATVLRAWLAGEAADVRGGGFMGREWDAFVPGPRIWREVFRVMKPGAHAAVFAGQRTAHWMGIALSLAGFEVRDLGAWLQWQGFPKSLDVSKELDKREGHWRGRAGEVASGNGSMSGGNYERTDKGCPVTEDTKAWEGWGTALKPAAEPWLLARKPLAGTVAANVLRWGTGALNIDAARYAYGDPAWPGPSLENPPTPVKNGSPIPRATYGSFSQDAGVLERFGTRSPMGRWPANIYYTPKAPTGERERYCEGLSVKSAGELVHREEGSAGMANPRAGAGRTSSGRRNSHPTVKPLAIMRWLCRLLTPPDGTVLDPFVGSATTALAAHAEGFRCLGAEMDADHFRIASTRLRNATATGAAQARLTATTTQPSLFGPAGD